MPTPFFQPGEAVTELAVFGVRVRILLPAAATGGAVSIFEDHNEPGAGPPLHVHHDADETFLIRAGRYRFHCDGAVLEGGPGDTVVVPRGAPHTFLNIGDGPGYFVCAMTPGGFEGFFAEVAEKRLVPPADMAAINAIAAAHHMEFLGPNPLASR